MTNASGPVFDKYARFYDLIYQDRDSVAEVSWIMKELDSVGLSSPLRLLELGSGTGRHAVLFAETGHSVVGVDPSPEMIRHAARHNRVNYAEGDGRSVRIAERFDAVLALFHVVSYQATDDDLLKIFTTASEHLDSGGIFGFDVWFSPAVHALGPERRTLEKEDEEVALTRTATPTEDLNKSLVTVTYDCSITDKQTGQTHQFQEQHLMRHFSATEIGFVANLTGFDVVNQSEFLSSAPPSRETWGVWFTLRKR